MTIAKNILVLLTYLLFACNGPQESEQKGEIKLEPNSEKDYSNLAKLFAQEILKENFRDHSFDIANERNPKFLKVFCSNGLETIFAYSNKNYPKKSEPDDYEHFTLFVATYINIKNAIDCFEQLKVDSKREFTEINDFEVETAERVKLLTFGAKPGGMITQKGRQIFSLVETCRETPIGGTWLNYESKFLNFITEDGEEIEVLNSDCGMNRYKIEKRKARR